MTSHAAAVIEGYKKNAIIMNFVTAEAREKVASEVRAALGGGTTAKAVEILEMRHQNIASRVADYVAAGLVGCYMASLA